jgi:hypothetical protein
MTPEEDRIIARSVAEAPLDQLGHYTREQIGAVMRTLVRDDPPRRFALYEVYEDDYGLDGELIAWGLDFEDHVIAQSPDYTQRGMFASPENALVAFRGGGQVELVWVDPPKPPED